ncbi:hypothetical protein LEP1GSC058_2823 [Leptospira fainei serovar Hurstbridge str. BUT 6]|uniref:Uncharacterized protein n=1 Tax=Leptospira fainei serovar Hurstbridge str. BUT 6 TaxID=1193011 RepID=S3UVH5_9LEPT|nr:hypothetical protein [Leptospira fainei]EPG74396.1 hypothetical protein LEP1GSC058_2823 [Leptospira fainei serovar Hurstbridge str. BUT 6]
MRPNLFGFRKSKRIRKLLSIFLIATIVLPLILYLIILFRLIPRELAQIQVRFAAKEGCSCLFVTKGNEEYCKRYTTVFYSPDGWDRTENSLSVTFYRTNEKFMATARFHGFPEGCRLVSEDNSK